MRVRSYHALLAGLTMLLSAFPCYAQRFTVAGRVVDAVTGVPLARASVVIGPLESSAASPYRQRPHGAQPIDGQQSTTTGADGRFLFPQIAAGRYRLLASRRGYLPSSLEEHGRFFAAVIAGPNKPTAASIRFPLVPLASIEGSVLDSSGDPVTQATASLYQQDMDGAGTVRSSQRSSLQRGSSHYEFRNLAPGTYFVAVTARPWFAENNPDTSGALDPLDVAYPVTFFPNADTTAAAQPIEVKAGEAATANFSLHAVPAVHIELPVNGINSLPRFSFPAFGGFAPLPAGAVYNQASAGGGGTTLVMSVAPGTYTLQRGGDSTSVNASADVTVNPAADSAGTTVSGRLAMADGTQVPDELVFRLFPDGGGTPPGPPDGFRNPGGRERDGFQGAPGLQRRPVEASVASDGSFHVDGVARGDYRLQVSSPANKEMVITGMASSGPRAADALIHVAADPVMVAATIVTADSAASGVVTTSAGTPASGAMVLLVPKDVAAGALYKQGESDSDGTWTVPGVAAGEYRVVAIRDGWSLTWKQPEVVSRYLRSAVAISVPPANHAQLASPVLEQQR